MEYHNREVARRGPNSKLLPIRDENLIYIGQTLFLPPRPERVVQQGSGKKHKASQPAVPVELKVKYSLGKDTPPVQWSFHSLDFDIKSELSGDITIEALSGDRHRINLEIALSQNSVEVKSKLKKMYDPALRQLLAEPKVKLEGNKVKLNSPIDPKVKGSIGGYDIEVTSKAPNHWSGTLKPATIKGTVEAEGRKYKYSADVEFKVDVHMRLKSPPVPEPVAVKVPVTQKEYLDNPTNHTNPVPDSEWKKMFNTAASFVGAIIIIDTIRRGSLNPAYAKVRPSCPLFIIITPGTMGPHYYELERQYNSQM